MASIEAEDREKEWAVLIECASAQPSAAHLSELLQAPVDWPALLVRAEEHGVLGLFVERLKDLHPAVPAEMRETLRQWERRQTVLALSLSAEMFRVLERFESLGIEALVTKG